MAEQALFDYFLAQHMPRAEVLNRLPFSVSIDEFWPQLQQLRRSHAVTLPLEGLNGHPLWFVMTGNLVAYGNLVSGMARRDIDAIQPGEDAMTDGLMDEAFFTSFVEGAPISRLESRRFLKSGGDPTDVGELLVQNNLSAIRYITEHRYEPFGVDWLLSAARLLTSAMDRETEGYRLADSHTIPGREAAVLRIPLASHVPRMMEALCCYLNVYEMHPLLKAAVAHAVIALVRPFDDGNERLARLVAYSVLLRSGYSFFRQFALSGMIAQDGLLYYQAMDTVQDPRGDGDLTCFVEYYVGMLSRGVTGFDAYIAHRRREESERKQTAEPWPEARDNQPTSVAQCVTKGKAKRSTPPAEALPVSARSEAGIAARAAWANHQADMRLAACTTPEELVSFIIRQPLPNFTVETIHTYIEKMRVTNEVALSVLRRLNDDISQRVLTIYSMFQASPDKMFGFGDFAESLGISKEPSRRACYFLVALKLVRLIRSSTRDSNHQTLFFTYGTVLAA